MLFHRVIVFFLNWKSHLSLTHMLICVIFSGLAFYYFDFYDGSEIVGGGLSGIGLAMLLWWGRGLVKFSPKCYFFLLTGGAAERPCPYKCISDRYHMPHCYTALEELIYTFGGPWLFGLILLGLLILLALVLSVARMKYVSADELPALVPPLRSSRIDHSFPFLESLNEVTNQFCFLHN